MSLSKQLDQWVYNQMSLQRWRDKILNAADSLEETSVNQSRLNKAYKNITKNLTYVAYSLK